MKKTLSRRLAILGSSLILSALAIFPSLAVTHAGHLDSVSATSISGWAWDSETRDSAVSVEITISGESLGPSGNTLLTTSADKYREDLNIVLGSGSHGFVYEIDWSNYHAGEYTVTAAAVSGETKTPLIGAIIYKKEDTPAPSTSETTGPVITPEQTAAPTPTGPASGPSSVSVPSEGPSGPSAVGPGSKQSPSSNKKGPSGPSATYGPGAPAYETGEADEYLGSFHATAYCGCQTCSGGYTHTYSGTIPQPNHTIAADLNLFPIGTKLLIDGIVYTVEDRGSSVVNNRIDIYFATHEEALAFGLKNVDVYSVK